MPGTHQHFLLPAYGSPIGSGVTYYDLYALAYLNGIDLRSDHVDRLLARGVLCTCLALDEGNIHVYGIRWPRRRMFLVDDPDALLDAMAIEDARDRLRLS